jgi:phage shock protein PspC (stress-responsive transcriptional regulator)
MKKIININFHSRVVPIEETAYEILQQYIDTLRRYFANEEGRDEIISDIENRFSELFAETLKKGATCITDADVDTIITSMGRPEDFEQEEMSSGTGTTGNSPGTGSNQQGGSSQQTFAETETATEPRRLFRSTNDKILGGVCGGLANYLKIDPAIVRIAFVLISFGWGAGFLLYIILWAVLPNKALPLNIRKRLYRNSDDRVIGGVASGLAAYFHIEVWIPRLIFALPLILSVLASILRSAWSWFDYDTPVFFTGGFGGTLFVTYIVLWIVLPEAVTASEKLEMRGEKVDLESIKNTIKSDLEGFKGRAKEMGSEMQERFQQVGKEVGQQTRKYTQSFASEAAPVIRRTGGGLGHAIGVLFKAFFLFIAGLIAFSLIMVLIGVVFKGDGILTFKNFVLAGFWQNFLSWTAFFLFLVIPVIALLTWLIRRITGVRSHNPYLGYTFATLWVIGLFCSIALAGMIIKDFRTRQHVEEDVRLVQPVKGKLVIRAADSRSHYYDNDWWFDTDWSHNGIFTSVTDDSLILNTIRVSLLKSVDSEYHVQIVKFSHGNNPESARSLAQQVVFPVNQTDSTLYLPDGFAITRGQKFRNQQVLVAVAIPVGKRILVNKNVERYRWFTINVNNRHIHWNERGDDDDNYGDDETPWSQGYSWNNNVEYVMTTKGLVRTDRKSDVKNNNDDGDDDDDDDDKKSGNLPAGPAGPVAPGNDNQQPATEKGGYRYHQRSAPAKPKVIDTVSGVKKTAMLENDSHLYLLSALFQ